MSLKSSAKWLAALMGAMSLSGCAWAQGVSLPPGTLVLGEVMHVLTRAMVDAGEIAPGEKHENLSGLLRSLGLVDAQIDQGRVVVLRDRLYWHNTFSANTYSQRYPAAIAEGLTVEPGNIVELRLAGIGGVVERVRAQSLAEGGCYYADVPVGAAVELLGALSLVGPRGSASLYCAGIERQGWQRPRTLWHKLADADGAAGLAAAASTAPPDPPSTEVVPGPAPADGAWARLILYLRPARTDRPYFHELPVWVDGQKVAALEQGTCDVVLLPPGEHVVVAGSAQKTFLRNYAYRELAISVSAQAPVVVEYVVDNRALVQSEELFELFRPEKWEPRIYRFTQRPATASDTCALRHEPTVLGGSRPASTPETGR